MTRFLKGNRDSIPKITLAPSSTSSLRMFLLSTLTSKPRSGTSNKKSKKLFKSSNTRRRISLDKTTLEPRRTEGIAEMDARQVRVANLDPTNKATGSSSKISLCLNHRSPKTKASLSKSTLATKSLNSPSLQPNTEK